MIYGNEADNAETYCYVIIEPLYNKFYPETVSLLDNRYFVESPFGKKEVYINKYGNMQIKSSYMILIDHGNFDNKKNKVLYLYDGGLITGGIICQWSKKPIHSKQNRVEEYKKLQKEIDELQLQQRELFCKQRIYKWSSSVEFTVSFELGGVIIWSNT